MSDNDPGRTMRIDIHPDFLGESLARKRGAHASRSSGETSFILSPSDRRSDDYQKLRESIYDALLVTDAKGRIVDFNSRASVFFLCADAELHGKKITGLISGADASLLEAIHGNLAEHRHTLIEAHCVRRDESTFPAEIAVNKVELDDAEQLCFFVRDITVRKHAQAALEDAVRRLEVHDKARSDFVSNVSHELRTPLTSMIYAVANLLRGVAGPLPEKVKHYIEMLEGDCNRLLGTVSDILDLRRIEGGTLELRKTKVPFGRLVSRVASSLRAQMENKAVDLGEQGVGGSWFVDCDSQKMERVILNVVGNAVKFTPEGGTIDVLLEDDPARGEHVLLTVRDSGVGIPSDALERVMERYFTVGEQASGTGLGLAISKEIVELHGGQIRIESPPAGRDCGTAVLISMPRAPAPTVLVVDDDESVRNLLERQIGAEGYSVVAVSDGARAMEVLETDPPDVVVLDLLLPEIRGTDIILRIKADRGMGRLPVIAITAASLDGSTSNLLRRFSIAAMPKPWDEGELLGKIAESLLGSAALVG
ncbi:MAG: response regulator [Lentisphaerae bacterium]|nr:response regulator [Lentisphaerota bacterium]